MASEIYYIPRTKGLLITSEFAEIQRRMDLKMDPREEYQKLPISDIDKVGFKNIGFEKVDVAFINEIGTLLQGLKFHSLAFHDCQIDLATIVFSCEHLVIGENCAISLNQGNFEGLREITFLSVKTFKGKISGIFHTVSKLILWYENRKSNGLLSHVPNLVELHIFNGNVEQLDLANNSQISLLQLHRCLKLQNVHLSSGHILKQVIVESCKKLDLSNLGPNVQV